MPDWSLRMAEDISEDAKVMVDDTKSSPARVDMSRLELLHSDIPLPRRVTRYQQWKEDRPLLVAGITGAVLFVVSFGGLVLLLKVMLPTMDPADAEHLKIPKSFEDLKALNATLQIYKEQHLFRVVVCFSSVYLLLQAFSLPGSMYLSILGGALFGLVNVLLVCTLIATGASLCYAISAALGPPLLAVSPKWTRRVEIWSDKVQAQGQNLASYLIVLRIAPLPPHWVVNVMAPHLGIRYPMFWGTTWFGVLGVTFIHTQIGTTLDEMTSPADFHLLSFKNALGLTGVVAAVLLPVIIRRVWSSEIADAAVEEPAIALPLEDSVDSLSSRTERRAAALREARLVFLQEDGQVDERRAAALLAR